MAQNSFFWTTNGTGDGPSGGYTMDDFLKLLQNLLTPDTEDEQGVLLGVGSDLTVTGSSSPVSLSAGAAIVYGLYYENTSALNLTVTTPVVGTTGGRVNLKLDWTAQTVRAVVQLNTDGTADIPALVQTAGVEWNLPLYTFTVTLAGVITLTRVASYCEFATRFLPTNMANVAALSVIGRASSSAGAAAEISAASDGQVLVRSGSALVFGQVQTAGLADGAITADKIAADTIDDTKVGNRVPQFYRRQGGSSSYWTVPGSSNYTPTTVRMQAGSVEITIANGDNYESVQVFFPTSYPSSPLVFAQIGESVSENMCVYTGPEGSNYFTATLRRNSTSGDATVTVYWLAIGPE